MRGWGILLLGLMTACAGGPGVMSGDGGLANRGAVKSEVTVALQHKFQELSEAAGFSGAVSVSLGGRVLLQAGYGWADVERQVPNTAATNFRIGSLTKQFTAAGLLVLAERGKLATSDPLSKWVPDFAPAPKLTLHQLATMSSGLVNATPNKSEAADWARPILPLKLVQKYQNLDLAFSPGQGFLYSNLGYDVLGLAMERATGQSWASWTEANLLRPAGMSRSAYDQAPDLATGYTDLWPGATSLNPSWAYSAGALESNVVDLTRWLEYLFGGQLLSATSLAKLQQPGFTDYAYGWFVGNLVVKGRSLKVLHHSGGYPGFANFMIYVPELELSLIMLCNFVDQLDYLDWGREVFELVL